MMNRQSLNGLPLGSHYGQAPVRSAVSAMHSQQQPGVGLFFHESHGKIKVKTIVSGGSAERDGRIQVGDTLIAIDGVDVRGQSQAAPFFKNLITGPEGSTVRLKMLRGEAQTAFGYELELFRGTPEYFAGLEQERKNEEELNELKLQLKQALAEEQQVAEEVDRIKRLLIAERQERERREKDQEQLEATFEEDRNQLSEALRKVETVKKDIEGKLAPVQQREAEFTEELARQTEKDRLRKEYIEELQKRHEERKAQLEQQLQIIRRQRAEEQVARMELQAQLMRAQAELKAALSLERAKADHDATFKARQEEEERGLFKELLENSDSLAGYVHEMQSRMAALNTGFFDGMPQGEQLHDSTAKPDQQANGYPDQYFLA